MNSVVTAGFLDRLGRLPGSVRQQASRAYALWRADPHLRASSSSGSAHASRSTRPASGWGTGHWGSGKGTRSPGSGSARMPSTTHSAPGYRKRQSVSVHHLKDNRCQFIISGTFRGRSSFLDGFAGQARLTSRLGVDRSTCLDNAQPLPTSSRGPWLLPLLLPARCFLGHGAGRRSAS